MPAGETTEMDGNLEVQDNTVLDVIKRKHAVRRFLPDAVPEEMIRRIVDAGRRAGSWKNAQPWRFIVVQDPDLREQIADLNTHARHLRGAAFGLALLGLDESGSGSPQFDFGRTIQNMMLTAQAYEVGSVIGYVSAREDTADLLGVPDGYTVEWLVSFGYPADPDDMQPGHRRLPLDEVLHWEQFGG